MENETVQRYEMVSLTRCGDAWQELKADKDGDWISYDDHLAVVNELREGQMHLAQEVDALKAEVERLVSAIDEEKVSCHIGIFERGDDPRKAINELMAWSQGVGEYFAKDKADHYYAANQKLVEENATLREQVERLSAPVSDLDFVECNKGYHCRHYSDGGICCVCGEDFTARLEGK